jgi:hypothetical protein
MNRITVILILSVERDFFFTFKSGTFRWNSFFSTSALQIESEMSVLLFLRRLLQLCIAAKLEQVQRILWWRHDLVSYYGSNDHKTKNTQRLFQSP